MWWNNIILFFVPPGNFLLQEYLKQFNELFGELQSKKVGVMAVCAQPQDKVDEMVKQCDLKFKVSVPSSKPRHS